MSIKTFSGPFASPLSQTFRKHFNGAKGLRKVRKGGQNRTFWKSGDFFSTNPKLVCDPYIKKIKATKVWCLERFWVYWCISIPKLYFFHIWNRDFRDFFSCESGRAKGAKGARKQTFRKILFATEGAGWRVLKSPSRYGPFMSTFTQQTYQLSGIKQSGTLNWKKCANLQKPFAAKGNGAKGVRMKCER